MKRLFTTLLALALLVLPAAPALAAEFEELDPPLWQALYYNSREEYMEAERLSAEDYIAQTQWIRAYRDAHPEQVAAFDADEYYVNGLWHGSPLFPKEAWMSRHPYDYPQYPTYTEADFRQEMQARWLVGLWRAHRERLHQDALVSLYPEDFAAFDADAWFSACNDGRPLSVSKAQYMAREFLPDETAFRLDMFGLCCDGAYRLERYAVALDGVPMDFSPNGGNRPLRDAGTPDREGALLVPARTFCEALGCAVTYAADTRAVTITRDGRTAVFTLDSADYTVDGAIRSMTDEAWVYEGRTYLPLPALADFLGMTWAWNGPGNTVFLQTTEKD